MTHDEQTEQERIEVKDEKLWKSTIKSFIIASVVTLSIVLGMKAIGIHSINLSGESMAPTFHDGTFMLIKDSDVSHDDIIVFTSPNSWKSTVSSHFIKRVVGVPGDKIIVTRDGVFVNEKQVKNLDDSYLDSIFGVDGEVNKELIVPDGKYFVIGDNYKQSNDSLYQLLHGNSEFLVDADSVLTSGDKLFSFQYKPNLNK